MQKSVLSLINYYKILQIPDYSNAPEIRRAYLKMAKQYHPDVNKGEEAEEIFKWINKANETLSDPSRKRVYDSKLRSGYLSQGVKNSQNSKEERLKRSRAERARRAEANRLSEIRNYQKSLEKFPLFARFGLFTLVLIYGMFLWYTHWIVNYADYSVYVLMLGMLLTIIGIVTLTDTYYKMLRIKQFKQRKNSHFNRYPILSMAIMVFVLPFLIVKLSYFRKDYHLDHYGEYVLARITNADIINEKVVYEYKVNEKVYEKKSTEIDKMYAFKGKAWMIIQYSKEDPVLAKPVDYLKHVDQLMETYK